MMTPLGMHGPSPTSYSWLSLDCAESMCQDRLAVARIYTHLSVVRSVGQDGMGLRHVQEDKASIQDATAGVHVVYTWRCRKRSMERHVFVKNLRTALSAE